MAKWNFWGDKEFSDVYENIYIRSLVEDWFSIVYEMTRIINSTQITNKRVLDIGCGEGHTTKQIIDRIEGEYICDLLEPNVNALSSAKSFLASENNIGECFQSSLSDFQPEKKYDVIFTSHTNYYWAIEEKEYLVQLKKISDSVNKNGKILILTLPENSGHYKIMLKEIYPKFNYAEYIARFYENMGLKVKVHKLKMRIFVGDILTTKSRFDLKIFYRFIHNTDSFPTDAETEKFLAKIKEFQEDGYIDFKDHLIEVCK